MPLCAGLLVLATDRPRDGVGQMAADEFLLQQAGGTSRAVLRFFHWSDRRQATCGYSTPAARVAQAYPNWQWTRRRTGGGLVFHDSDCTLSLVLPRIGPFASLAGQDFYALLHQEVAAALRAAGADPQLWKNPSAQRPEPAPNETGTPCFTSPVPHDLLDPDGAKIAGGALRRTKSALLYQGSLRLPPGLESHFRQLLPGFLAPDWLPHPGLTPEDEDQILHLRRKYWPDPPAPEPGKFREDWQKLEGIRISQVCAIPACV